MLRRHPIEESNIVVSHIKQLVSEFPTTIFSLNDLPNIGGRARVLVSESTFWNDKDAVSETMEWLRGKNIVKYDAIDWTKNTKFAVIVENLNGLSHYVTPQDIMNNIYMSLQTTLGEKYKTVFDNLRDAGKLLSVKNSHDYSDVGHKCQVAYEEFLDSLIKELGISTVNGKEKTKNHLTEILATKKNGSERQMKLVQCLDEFHHDQLVFLFFSYKRK
jgi:hypothetical protein